ncbi:hypothetical protein APK26_gp10 [Acinetobacter phage vB_AbaP_APK26]|uniref:Uncharacterized protein n=1 Tax=Acinetobacter phage vB_AbaP_APK26 TaxID=2797420 RepID=A0A7T8F132_9CAUD|nr:hypothetical protein APK26_gp10 [Acinetobacter phage vB_AbaP_APK26]
MLLVSILNNSKGVKQ